MLFVRSGRSWGYAARVAIVLEAGAVRQATAALMAFRLRERGFTAGQGGDREADFTEQTTPTLTHATEVTTRNAALVSDDFPTADASDEPELRTIAALRSAIELEASAPTMDPERIRAWRDQLREHVSRVAERSSSSAGGDDAGEGSRVLAPVWDFGDGVGGVTVYDVDGAEMPRDTSRRRLRW
jgi:hypothetical protein